MSGIRNRCPDGRDEVGVPSLFPGFSDSQKRKSEKVDEESFSSDVEGSPTPEGGRFPSVHQTVLCPETDFGTIHPVDEGSGPEHGGYRGAYGNPDPEHPGNPETVLFRPVGSDGFHAVDPVRAPQEH